LPPKSGSLAYISSRIELAGASLVEMLRALEKSAEELEQAGIREIRETFDAQPGTLLLSAPKEVIMAPAPPADKWLRSPKLVFTPQAPSAAGFQALSAGPQAPTLAGPCLPPQLRNFTENAALSQRPPRKRAGAPTWLISVLVATALFIGAGSLLQYLTSNRDAKAASVSAAAPQVNDSASASGVPVAQEHPGARFVEIAGVRVVAPANKRPQMQYLIINHSAGELTGLNIHVAVHSADAPTGNPLFTVSSVISSLAANQSKEIRTDLDPEIKPSSLPDWQNLRTEVLITRQ
jgi:hypothetical protein